MEQEGSYPMAGVYGFGRGILLRDPVRGAEISAAHLYRIARRQIIYSRLKAFEGAFALVPDAADGRFVSNEFPTFDVDETQALPEYLALVLALPATWAEMSQHITGVGARRERLQVADFLDFELDLPPLDAQRRVVDGVSAAASVADALAAEAAAASDLAKALYAEMVAAGDADPVPMGDLLTHQIDAVPVVSDGEYPMAGVTIAGKGLFWREVVRGTETKYAKLHRLATGDLVYRKLTAWEGPITVVPAEFDGAFVSPEFPTFRIDTARVSPNYLRFVCQQSWFHAEMKAGSTGTAERRSRLNPNDLLDIEIELPAPEDQAKVAAATALAESLRRQEVRARALALAIRDEFFQNGLDGLGEAGDPEDNGAPKLSVVT